MRVIPSPFVERPPAPLLTLALAARGVTLEEAVEAIEQQGFAWGTSDGN